MIASPTPIPRNQFVELWFALAGRSWTSLTLVPADPGGSLADVAMEVAEAGKRMDGGPVIAFPIKTLDAFSAHSFADLQRALALGVSTLDWGPLVAVSAGVVESRDGAGPDRQATPAHRSRIGPSSTGRMVISLPSVIEEPLGLAIAQSSSVVVVTIELGRTRIADAQRTIELIGRARIAGCVLVGPRHRPGSY